MNIVGADFLQASIESDGYFFKLILNESAAHFFPYTTEHRDATLPGLCYRDDSLGNALAATIKPKQVDVRFHREFSDQRVKAIFAQLLDHAEIQPLEGFSLNYQGRPLIH